MLLFELLTYSFKCIPTLRGQSYGQSEFARLGFDYLVSSKSTGNVKGDTIVVSISTQQES